LESSIILFSLSSGGKTPVTAEISTSWGKRCVELVGKIFSSLNKAAKDNRFEAFF
jgi:hypothetical protein